MTNIRGIVVSRRFYKTGWMNDATRLETRIEESKPFASITLMLCIVKATYNDGRFF